MVEYKNKKQYGEKKLAIKRKRPVRPSAQETSAGIDAKKRETKKKNTVVYSISQVFRNLSISINLTIYAIYLVYLIYSITADVGVKPINIALALVTAAFMVVYLVLRLSGKRKGKQLKQITYYYKNFKLVARTASAITAVYALITAIGAVSPFAIIIAFLGAVFLVFRLIVELVLFLIRRKIRKICGNRHQDEPDETDDEEEAQKPAARRKRKRKLWEIGKKDEHLEDIIIPVDKCLLNDIDEDSTIFDNITLHIE